MKKFSLLLILGVLIIPNFCFASTLYYNQPIHDTISALKVAGPVQGAVSFVAPQSFTITQIKTWGRRVGTDFSPTTLLILNASSSGLPTGTAIFYQVFSATSTPAQEQTFDLINGPLLKIGERYALVFTYPAGDYVNNYNEGWGATTGSVAGSVGSYSVNSGANWTWGSSPATTYLKIYGDPKPVGLGISVLNFTATATDGALAYAGQLFTDLKMIIIMIIGLPLGFWIINKVIDIGSKRTEDLKKQRNKLKEEIEKDV